MKKYAPILSAFLVAACMQETTTSGGTNTTPSPTPEVVTQNVDATRESRNLPWSFSIELDSTASNVTLNDSAGAIVLARMPSLDNSNILAYFRAADEVALMGTTPTGAGQAASLVNAASGYGGIAFERLTQSELPTSGNAVFNGAYSGLLSRSSAPTDFATHFVLWGDFTMTANFDTGNISGLIQNRETDLGDPFDDIALSGTTIANGAFDGTASGGDGTGALTTTTSNGQYSGMIVGADGTEIVGGLVLDHSIFALPYVERGVFITD